MNKKRLMRVLALALAMLMLVGTMLTLTSCGGGSKAPDYSWKAEEDAATYFARLLLLEEQYFAQLDAKKRPAPYSARTVFIAATRGYNMTAEGFDASADAPDLKVVDKAGIKAALDRVKPTDDSDIVKYNELYAQLVADDAQALRVVTLMAAENKIEVEAENKFLDKILIGIGWFMKLLTNITGGSYVLGLFIFAIVVEALMIPFGIKQQKNSIKQAKMRPKEMAIRNKYKGRNDQATQQKMAQEIQKMYQEEGFNPMGGCLPLLIQLPIILALYRIVIDPLRYVLGLAQGVSNALTVYCNTAKAAGGLGLNLGTNRGTIEMISQAGDKLDGLQNFAFFSNSTACYEQLKGVDIPNFNVFGINMGQVPTFTSILVLVPILTFVFYFFSMKLTRKFTYQPAMQDAQMGCSNNVMDIGMPLMSVYIAFIVPAAVGIYWIFKSLLTTLKQFILSKTMPLPVFTEEDYKAAERALKGKAKTERKQAGERVTKSGVKVRSLHYIDADDEPLPPTVPDKVEEDKAKSAADAETPAEETAVEEASAEETPAVPNLKADRKDDQKKKK